MAIPAPMALSISAPASSSLIPVSRQVGRWTSSASSAKPAVFNLRRPVLVARAGGGNAPSSPVDEVVTELDVVSSFSEIVPDTVVFDDFEKFAPTAATVSSSLLLGIVGLPDTKFKSAIDTALVDGECNTMEKPGDRMSCYLTKALGNVGAELSNQVPGRVSTEIDARLAYDTQGIIQRVHELLQIYNEHGVLSERLLFKIPATWQGIEASRLLESEGTQTHLTFVYSFAQAAAAAQAGASVVQIFVGRIRDWARNHSGDPEIDEALKKGEDAGLALVKKAYAYIHRNGYKTKLMAAAVRNKQDVFSLLGIDYIIVPVKILQSLDESVTDPDEKYGYVQRLTPSLDKMYNFTEEELVKWDQLSLAAAMGPAAEELLASGLEGYANQARRVEELFGKIWPPPNV
ncbi:transaldolase isoform X1 [Lolium rigidum]|uniref:transaldolase isoform X1 n=1 Tax=Lolium rigidum TaxID=89674 RepID=UPI001F5D67A3|nr:transaldolase isoform X1 [Lolium rigidum]